MESREEKGFQDKTEEATEEKKNQFREEGNVASPKEVVSFVTLILFTSYFYFYANDIMKSFRLVFNRSWLGFPAYFVDYSSLIKVLYYATSPILPHFFLIIFLCTIFPLLFGLLLTRFNWSWKKINFDINRINPLSGFARMFSAAFLIEFFKILLKCAALSILIYLVLKSEIGQSSEDYFFSNIDYLKELGKSIFHLLLLMCIAGIVIGISDFSYNLWKLNNDMKMTKQEVKEEVKKHEGDPLLRSQRKRMARDLVMRKSLKDVPKSTFVVTNPEHFSVAVRYVKGMNAPIVVAKGQDLIAFKIREIAKQHDIMIVENKPLARTLYKTVKVGQEIPQSLYQSIIEVIKYIYQMRGKKYFDRF
ncbi:EscU/YscU/HrcU family type III secretion system export apparatus switch protein [Pigmentibacter sp. JX0631]|uniref:EscU/YscU/HrcU family type III secretion system export apparatus switch protein n=1 Tax=Pigmentibacter sp. JX0631 TaxID=2976982 RepID=UPI0024692F6D|nr:EscU/YscU/HrcU family type III secretion system export apparatus switch protein [Pigmentibacter sp. JX0631]WGL58686.1 EscU/YscU/HrcU family type III secretion system export apparatus switch protein [Pigmentibacter sp. JX0631]